MWHQRFPDPDDLRPFFDAARAIGFNRFDLSHTHSAAGLATIPPDVTIASVHHPCPNDGPLALLPGDDATSPDPAARNRWQDALRRTIGTAERLGASAVCAHLGTAHDERVRKLWFEIHSRYQAGQAGMPRYAAALAELRERLAVIEPAAIERAVDVLAGVVGQLRTAGVALGIETGYHAWELPTAGGMTALLDGIEAAMPGAVVTPAAGKRTGSSSGDDGVIGAWLDTGHVGVQVNVGIATFEGWFEAVAAAGGRWVGVHWHDVVGVRDHLAPGVGRVDLLALASAMHANGRAARHTLEIDWYFDALEVRMAGEVVRQLDDRV